MKKLIIGKTYLAEKKLKIERLIAIAQKDFNMTYVPAHYKGMYLMILQFEEHGQEIETAEIGEMLDEIESGMDLDITLYPDNKEKFWDKAYEVVTKLRTMLCEEEK